MQEIVLKIRLFERGLLKKIKKVNFIFPFKPNLYPNIHLLYIYIYIYIIYIICIHLFILLINIGPEINEKKF